MKELQDIVREFEKRSGESFGLATLVRARGSSYRRPGARMLIGGEGASVGPLSGGCLEEEVATLAQEVIRSKLISFDMRRRFGCLFAAASVESLRNRKAPIHAISYNLSKAVRATR